MKNIILKGLTITTLVLTLASSANAGYEIRSNSLSIKQKEKWITVGDHAGPAHMHVNSELIKRAEFVQEQKPEKISFSVRFFNESDERVLAAFFTKMYDDSKQLVAERKKLYDQLNQKFTSKIQF